VKKFYVRALVGVLIKWFYEMHGATMKTILQYLHHVTWNGGNEGKNISGKKDRPVAYVKVKFWHKYGEICGM